jgi:integrase
MKDPNQAKRGPKAKHWTDSRTGKPVEGLTKQKDGRWRIIGTATKFTEADEQKAIAKFKRMTAQTLEATLGDGTGNGKPVKWEMNPYDLEVYLQLMTDKTDAPFWERVVWELTNRKEYAAQKTGIEKLAYLHELRPPEPEHDVNSLSANWDSFAKCAKDAKRKVTRAWEGFIGFTAIKTIEDITPQICVKYADHVHATVESGKQQQHLFNGARRILTFNMKRAIAVRACASALECMRLMAPNRSTRNKNPKPIKVDDWKALLKKAKGEDRAMVLCMLNFCMYAGEVVRLKWSELDFTENTMVSRRKKKGEFIRVATLWAETVEALRELDPSKGPYVFMASGGAAKGKPLKKDGAFNRLRELITEAELVGVKPSHLRDGAYGAAVKANISEDLVNIFTGHSNDMADMYVMADPTMVQPACDGVYRHYFGVDEEAEKAKHIEALKALGVDVEGLEVKAAPSKTSVSPAIH